jgi:hypothetical protein
MVEQAGQRRPPLLRAVGGGGLLGCVGAKEVVHAVPARPGGLDQVRAGEQIKHRAGPFHRGGRERGGGVPLEAGAGVQAQQPERAGGTGVQVLVGPGEHRPHRGARIPARAQQVQPRLLVGQLTGQLGEGGGGAGDGELGGYPQRQRQPRAPLRQHLRRQGIGVQPVADQRPQ